jgi:hypothetical protein
MFKGGLMFAERLPFRLPVGLSFRRAQSLLPLLFLVGNEGVSGLEFATQFFTISSCSVISLKIFQLWTNRFL